MMHFLNTQILILCWITFIITTALLILLWFGKFNVQASTIEESVFHATVLIRVVNFFLTSEILLFLTALYGTFVWHLITKRSMDTQHSKQWKFYDGGSRLLPTFKVIFTSGMAISIKLVATLVFLFMLGAYFLDIFNVKSIMYTPINQCKIQNVEIDLAKMGTNQDDNQSVYAVGYKLGLLPYSQHDYSTNAYQIPVISSTHYLEKFTTIQFNVTVHCQEVTPKVFNTTYVEVKGMSDVPTILYGINSIGPLIVEETFTAQTDTTVYSYFIVTVAQYQERKDGSTFIMSGNNSVTAAHCSTSTNPYLINDYFDWKDSNTAETSARYLATESSKAPVSSYQAYGPTDPFIQWLVSRDTLHALEQRITIATVEFLKGSGNNGSTTSVGYFCFPDQYKTSIKSWYVITYTIAQVLSFIMLLFYTIATFNKDFVSNDTDTLLRYLNEGDTVKHNKLFLN